MLYPIIGKKLRKPKVLHNTKVAPEDGHSLFHVCVSKQHGIFSLRNSHLQCSWAFNLYNLLHLLSGLWKVALKCLTISKLQFKERTSEKTVRYYIFESSSSFWLGFFWLTNCNFGGKYIQNVFRLEPFKTEIWWQFQLIHLMHNLAWQNPDVLEML